MNELVSIIIPVYNVEKYLAECLESVINQTYNNLEIICVEDCSTDSSLHILEAYQQKDNRIRVIKAEKNVGLARARNIGMESAKGRYLYFLDSDDYIKSDAIETLLLHSLKYDTECVFFDSTLKKESMMISDMNVSFNLPEHDCIPMSGRRLLKLICDNNTYASSVWRQFWKSEFLQKQNIQFDSHQVTCEDMYFTVQALLKGNRMMVLNKSLHTYRRRAGSLVFSLTARKAQDAFHSWYNMLQLLQGETEDDDIKVILKSMCERALISAKRFYEVNRSDSYVFEDEAEGLLFKYMIQDCDVIEAGIEEETLQEIKRFQHVIVYGTGRNAIDVVYALERNKIQIDYVAVSDGANEDTTFMGYCVNNIQELNNIKDEAIVVIAVGQANKQAVINKLNEEGFPNYISLKKT